MNIGDTFGRLTVTGKPFKPDPTKYAYFVECECSCGSGRKLYRKSSLTKKAHPVKSCGCLQREAASTLRTVVKVGDIFHRLTVVADLGVVDGRRFVRCKCECGKEIEVRKDSIENGHTKSFGCLYDETRGRETHGMCGTPEYRSWQSMKDRCINPDNPRYQHYGGRGITYETKWETFEGFYEDMGERPEGTSLDRIDVDGNYCKENCRWADATIQGHNRRKFEGFTSNYQGVYFDKSRGKWVSRLQYYGELVHFQRHEDEISAAKAYDNACMEYYGVHKNFPDKLEE